MKSLLAILLSVVILLPPLGKCALVAGYQLNKNYIAEFLCENRDKPASECQGKCHLSKQLKAADAHEESLPAPLKNKAELVYFCQVFAPVSFPVFYSSEPSFAVATTGAVQKVSYGIFHPPRLLV